MGKSLEFKEFSFENGVQLALEPLQIMWSKRKLLGSLLTFPLICVSLITFFLPSFCAIESMQEATITQIAIHIILALVQPLWAIAWLRTLFYPNEQVTIKTYFTISKFHFYFLLCLIFLQLLNMPLEYLGDSNILNKFALLIIWLIWTILILPLHLLFPAIALRKPFSIWKTWSLAKPFYTQYLLSLLLISLLFSIAVPVFIYVSGFALTSLYITAPRIFQFLYQWWPQTLASQMVMLFMITYLLTLPSLYYKKYLIKK